MNRAGNTPDAQTVVDVIMKGQFNGIHKDNAFDAVNGGAWSAVMVAPESRSFGGISLEKFALAGEIADGHFWGRLPDTTNGAQNFFRGYLPDWAYGDSQHPTTPVVVTPTGYTGRNVFWQYR
jgi:hypothetical protein